QPTRKQVGDRLQATQQRQHDEHGGTHGGIDHAEPLARDGVSRCLAMRFDADTLGELFRHAARMRRNVPDLARSQPELEPDHGDQERDEQECEAKSHAERDRVWSRRNKSACENRARKIMSQPLSTASSMRDTRYDDNNLIWVDMEMSGLNPDCDRV